MTNVDVVVAVLLVAMANHPPPGGYASTARNTRRPPTVARSMTEDHTTLAAPLDGDSLVDTNYFHDQQQLEFGPLIEETIKICDP